MTVPDAFVAARWSAGREERRRMMYQGGWFGMGFGWLIWIVLIVAVVLLVVWAVGRANAARSRPQGAESAEEILKQRYARGEIDRDEYHRRLTDLRR